MKISFDLDGTLIPLRPGEFPTENISFFQKLVGVELVRKGSARLFRQLREKGHQVGIYTSSYRSRQWIWFQLLTYGIRCDFVINETLSRKELSKRGISCSKFPPAFGIDLHIDDSAGVELEGQKFNFLTLLLLKDEADWLNRIINRCGNQV